MHRDAKKDVEVIPTSSTDIKNIQVEYIVDEAEMKQKKAHADRSQPADIDSVLANKIMTTSAMVTKGIVTFTAILSDILSSLSSA